MTGIDDLETQMLVCKIRWAASVYARDMPTLRQRAERILWEYLPEDVGMVGAVERLELVTVVEDTMGAEFSDRSRRDGHTAAATTRQSWHLGTRETVMDAEILGIVMGWKGAEKVATDSQGAIGSIPSRGRG